METQTEQTEERFTELLRANLIKLPLYSARVGVSPWERFGCLSAEEQAKIFLEGERLWALKGQFDKLLEAGVMDVPEEHWKPAVLRATPWEIFKNLDELARARVWAQSEELLEDKAIFEKLTTTGLLDGGVTWASLKRQGRSYRLALFDAALALAKLQAQASKKSFILGVFAMVATVATMFAFAYSGTWIFRAVVSMFALDLPHISMFGGFVLHSLLFSAHTLAAMTHVKSEMPEQVPTEFPNIDERNADFRYRLRLHGTLTASALFTALICWVAIP